MTDNTCSEWPTRKATTPIYRHSSPDPGPIVIVDACQYGLLGLQYLLTDARRSSGHSGVYVYARVERALAAQQLRAVRDRTPSATKCLVLRLSTSPGQALQQLLQLEGEGIARAGFQSLIVLSPFAMNNVIRHALICCDARLPVRIVSARSPLTGVQRVVLSQGTLLQGGEDALLPRMPALVLSPPERRVLSGTLREIPIHQQARQLGLSPKTLYSQRHHALLKLRASGLSVLLRRFVSM